MRADQRRLVLGAALVGAAVWFAGSVEVGVVEDGGIVFQSPPAPAGVLEVGELRELRMAAERLGDETLTDVQVDGDVLYGARATPLGATGERARVRPLAVHLTDQRVVGQDGMLVVDDVWRRGERYVAWSARYGPEANRARLYVFDVQTGEEITVGGEGAQRWPDVSYDLIVWAEVSAETSWDIFGYNVASGERTALVGRAGAQMVPKVSDEWLIYSQGMGGEARSWTEDLYLRNLSSGEELRIGPSPHAVEMQGGTYGIANGRVVWRGWPIGVEPTSEGPLPAMHVYDVAERRQRKLENLAACDPWSFKMAGDLILVSCSDGRYIYDLAQDRLVPVPYKVSIGGWPEGAAYLSESFVVYRVRVKGRVVWDIPTPGVTPTPTGQVWPTPQPRRYQFMVVPIWRAPLGEGGE